MSALREYYNVLKAEGSPLVQNFDDQGFEQKWANDIDGLYNEVVRAHPDFANKVDTDKFRQKFSATAQATQPMAATPEQPVSQPAGQVAPAQTPPTAQPAMGQPPTAPAAATPPAAPAPAQPPNQPVDPATVSQNANAASTREQALREYYKTLYAEGSPVSKSFSEDAFVNQYLRNIDGLYSEVSRVHTSFAQSVDINKFRTKFGSDPAEGSSIPDSPNKVWINPDNSVTYLTEKDIELKKQQAAGLQSSYLSSLGTQLDEYARYERLMRTQVTGRGYQGALEWREGVSEEDKQFVEERGADREFQLRYQIHMGASDEQLIDGMLYTQEQVVKARNEMNRLRYRQFTGDEDPLQANWAAVNGDEEMKRYQDNPGRGMLELGRRAIQKTQEQAAANLNHLQEQFDASYGEGMFEQTLNKHADLLSAVQERPQDAQAKAALTAFEYQNKDLINSPVYTEAMGNIKLLSAAPKRMEEIRKSVPEATRYEDQLGRIQQLKNQLNALPWIDRFLADEEEMARKLGIDTESELYGNASLYGVPRWAMRTISRGLSNIGAATYKVGAEEWGNAMMEEAREIDDKYRAPSAYQRYMNEDYVELDNGRLAVVDKNRNLEYIVGVDGNIDEGYQLSEADQARVDSGELQSRFNETVMMNQVADVMGDLVIDALVTKGVGKFVRGGLALGGMNAARATRIGMAVGQFMSPALRVQASSMDAALAAGATMDEAMSDMTMMGIGYGISSYINPIESRLAQRIGGKITVGEVGRNVRRYLNKEISRFDLVRAAGYQIATGAAKEAFEETFESEVLENVINYVQNQRFGGERETGIEGEGFAITKLGAKSDLRAIGETAIVAGIVGALGAIATDVSFTKSSYARRAILSALQNPEQTQALLDGLAASNDPEVVERVATMRGIIDQVKPLPISDEQQAMVAALIMDRDKQVRLRTESEKSSGKGNSVAQSYTRRIEEIDNQITTIINKRTPEAERPGLMRRARNMMDRIRGRKPAGADGAVTPSIDLAEIPQDIADASDVELANGLMGILQSETPTEEDLQRARYIEAEMTARGLNPDEAQDISSRTFGNASGITVRDTDTGGMRPASEADVTPGKFGGRDHLVHTSPDSAITVTDPEAGVKSYPVGLGPKPEGGGKAPKRNPVKIIASKKELMLVDLFNKAKSGKADAKDLEMMTELERELGTTGKDLDNYFRGVAKSAAQDGDVYVTVDTRQKSVDAYNAPKKTPRTAAAPAAEPFEEAEIVEEEEAPPAGPRVASASEAAIAAALETGKKLTAAQEKEYRANKKAIDRLRAANKIPDEVEITIDGKKVIARRDPATGEWSYTNDRGETMALPARALSTVYAAFYEGKPMPEPAKRPSRKKKAPTKAAENEIGAEIKRIEEEFGVTVERNIGDTYDSVTAVRRKGETPAQEAARVRNAILALEAAGIRWWGAKPGSTSERKADEPTPTKPTAMSFDRVASNERIIPREVLDRQVANVLRALSKIANVRVIIHNGYDLEQLSPEFARRYAGRPDEIEDAKKSRGFVDFDKDNVGSPDSPFIIYIRADKALMHTVAHEAAHVLFLQMFATDPNKARTVAGVLRNALLKGTAEEKKLAASLDRFIAGYARSGEAIQAEEFFAELFGILAASRQKITKGTAAQMAKKLNDILKSFIPKQFHHLINFFPKEPTVGDIIDFVNTMSGKVDAGDVITTEDLSKFLPERVTTGATPTTPAEPVVGQRWKLGDGRTITLTEVTKDRVSFRDENNGAATWSRDRFTNSAASGEIKQIGPGSRQQREVRFQLNEIELAADQIAAMDQDTREDMHPWELPGGIAAFQLFEARGLLKKPSDKLKRVTDNNSFELYNNWHSIANIDGVHFGLTRYEDPDAVSDEEDSNGFPKEFIWAWAPLREPDSIVEMLTNDTAEAVAEMRKYVQNMGTSGATIRSQLPAEEQQIIDQAKAAGNFMKAPNGKPSNLDERQWAQVRTKAFKNWFGDWQNDPKNASKVVDENGEPLVVYHGSRSMLDFAFSEFNVPNEGVFFTSDYKTATWFSQGRLYNKLFFEEVKMPNNLNENSSLEDLINYYRENLDPTARIEEVIRTDENNTLFYRFNKDYDNISSPLGIDINEAQKKLYNSILWDIENVNKSSSYPFYEVFLNIRKPHKIDAKGNPFYKTPFEGEEYSADSVSAEIKNRGKNDGLIIKNTIEGTDNYYQRKADTYIVFSPSQIKSATENVGTFSPTTGDIRYQIVGENASLSKNVRDNLDVARLMEAESKAPFDIRITTGWERGSDGRWKYEIDDTAAQIKLKGFAKEEVFLKDVLSHPELFKAHPDLKDISIRVIPFDEMDSDAAYIRQDDSIRLASYLVEGVEDANDEFLLKKKLQHEVQHAIQVREKWRPMGAAEIRAVTSPFNLESPYSDVEDDSIELVYDFFSEAAYEKKEKLGDLTGDERFATQLIGRYLQAMPIEIKPSLSGAKVTIAGADAGSRYSNEDFTADKNGLEAAILEDIDSFQVRNDVNSLKEAKDALKKDPENEELQYVVDRLSKEYKLLGEVRKGNFTISGGAITPKAELKQRLSAMPDFVADTPLSQVQDFIVGLYEGVDEFDVYNRTATEVEARNVENRLDMPEGVRRLQPLAWTEDVDADSQIFFDERGAVQGVGDIRYQIDQEIDQLTRGPIDPFVNGIGGSAVNYSLNNPADIRQQISADNSGNYANLTEDGEGNFVFYHYSQQPLEEIDPGFYGSNQRNITSREERAAIGRVGGVSMYYPREGVQESGTGGYGHIVKIPKDRVYDFNSDPLKLRPIAKQRAKEQNPDLGFGLNEEVAFTTKIAYEYGFDMLVAEWVGGTRAQTTQKMRPVDTQTVVGNAITKKFSRTYESNYAKGYRSVFQPAKKTQLADVYERITNTVGNNYSSPLYRLREMGWYEPGAPYAPFKSQEQIAETIHKYAPQELVDEYEVIMSAPNPQHYSEITPQGVVARLAKQTEMYTAALANGDTDTADRAVEEAAARMDYTQGPVANGSEASGIRVYDPTRESNGFFFNNAQEFARMRRAGLYVSGEPARVAIRMTNPADLTDPDTFVRVLENSAIPEQEYADVVASYEKGELYGPDGPAWQDALAESAQQLGHDGMIMFDTASGAVENSYVIFKPQQAQLLDTTVFDDAGVLVPLEERFNPNNPDLRFQRRMEATEELRSVWAEERRPSVEEASRILGQFESWRDWYDGFMANAEELFGEYAADVVVLITTSAHNNDSPGTVRDGLRRLDVYYKSGTFNYGMTVMQENAVRYFLGMGPKKVLDKIPSFLRASFGDPKAIAVDRWVLAFMLGRKATDKEQGDEKLAAEAKQFISDIADVLGWEPREVQAAAWAAGILADNGVPDDYETYMRLYFDEGFYLGLQAGKVRPETEEKIAGYEFENVPAREIVQSWREQGIRPILGLHREEGKFGAYLIDDTPNFREKLMQEYAAMKERANAQSIKNARIKALKEEKKAAKAARLLDKAAGKKRAVREAAAQSAPRKQIASDVAAELERIKRSMREICP